MGLGRKGIHWTLDIDGSRLNLGISSPEICLFLFGWLYSNKIEEKYGVRGEAEEGKER